MMRKEFEENLSQDDWNYIAAVQTNLGIACGDDIYFCISQPQKQKRICYLYLKAILSLAVHSFWVFSSIRIAVSYQILGSISHF